MHKKNFLKDICLKSTKIALKTLINFQVGLETQLGINLAGESVKLSLGGRN